MSQDALNCLVTKWAQSQSLKCSQSIGSTLNTVMVGIKYYIRDGNDQNVFSLCSSNLKFLKNLN